MYQNEACSTYVFMSVRIAHFFTLSYELIDAVLRKILEGIVIFFKNDGGVKSRGLYQRICRL